MEDFLYKNLTYKIRRACFQVYKQFGGAFKESIVDKALIIALRNEGLKVESQKRIDIYFQGQKVGSYVPDKVINDVILLEIKCKQFLTQEDRRQFWFYLRGSPYKIGLLVNFGPQKLEIVRRIYDKARYKNPA